MNPLPREPPLPLLKFPKLITIAVVINIIISSSSTSSSHGGGGGSGSGGGGGGGSSSSGGSRLHQIETLKKNYKVQTVGGCYVHSKKRQRESLWI